MTEAETDEIARRLGLEGAEDLRRVFVSAAQFRALIEQIVDLERRVQKLEGKRE